MNTRLESYYKSEPLFNRQELEVLRCINMGLSDAWSISEHSNMLITSVRRALTDLEKKGKIQKLGTVYNKTTDRNVTTYKIIEVNKQLLLI